LYNLLKFPVFILVAIPIAFFTFLLAFYKSGNQSFGQFVLNILSYISKPSIYTWKKSAPTKMVQEEKQETKETLPKATEPTTKKTLPKKDELEDISWRIEIGSLDSKKFLK